MNKFLLLSILLALTSCSSANNSNENRVVAKESGESEVARASEIQDDSFDAFLFKFSKNREFQLSRIEFPLTVKLLDIVDEEEVIRIAKGEWEHFDLLDTIGIENRKIDAFYQTVETTDSTATLLRRGIDNGIRINYKFIIKEGQWYLTEIFNSST